MQKVKSAHNNQNKVKTFAKVEHSDMKLNRSTFLRSAQNLKRAGVLG
jgi:hypothetical protein